MKYCSHCGRELLDEAIVCPGCGCAVEKKEEPKQPETQPTSNNSSYSGLSIGGFVCAFLMPLIGLILSIVARNNAVAANDMKSKSFAKAGIIVSIVMLVFSLISGILSYNFFMAIFEGMLNDPVLY